LCHWVRRRRATVRATLLTGATENNPEVMSSLLHELGLSDSVGFHDVYSIDEPDLLAFVPRPAYALLLVFPVSETYKKFRREEDAGRPEYQGSGPDEEVLWFKQTIGNACGLIGLLHGASNGPVTQFIGEYSCPPSELDETDQRLRPGIRPEEASKPGHPSEAH
jgi:ubiquitin carboxyl-terminal hydrolase L3